MPTYTPRPYVRSPYTADTRQLGNLYARQGEMLAESQRMRGATSNQFLAGLAAAFRQIQEQQQIKAIRAEEAAMQQAELQRADQIRQEERAIRAAEKQEAEARYQQGQDRDAAIYASENTTPGPLDARRAEVMRKFPGTAAKLRLQDTLPAMVTPGAVGAVDQQPSQFDVLEPTPQQIRQSQQDTAAREREAQAAKDREEDNKRQSARDAEAKRHNLAQERAAGSRTDAEPLIAVIGDDGQPVYLPRSQAAGRRPASNREQGRPVTSGDAGRIADFDTSLDDVRTLAATLQDTKDATGVRAQAGAALWNPITNLTGWGRDAKVRQGVIDRVKQVIGKALEGGVLRKEDEIKYAKILPTIGDDPVVAASKLNGLRAALVERRQTTLDALDDAGYDVERFRERTPITAAPDLTGLSENSSRTFRSGPFAGQEWALVNGTPTRIK